jgi:hypothetical protein
MQEVHLVDTKLSDLYSVDNDTALNLISVKDAVLEYVEDHFLETIRVATHHDAVASPDGQVDAIADVLEITKRNILIGDLFDCLDAHSLIPSHTLNLQFAQMRLAAQCIHTKGETHKGDLHLPETF